VKLKMDKDRKKILDRRAKGRAEALGKDKGKLNTSVFGPPRSGSISQCQRYGSGTGSFPFLRKVLSGLK
jgi:hypothetical protein